VVEAAMAATAPLAGPALALGAPGGAVARALVLSRLPGGTRTLDGLRGEVDRWGARFDGRLRVATVDRASGRRVVFGRPAAPQASVGEAVAASCAIPGVFAPVRIGERAYVDGGAWSVTNLDTAPAGRETEVLCLSVSAGLPLSPVRAAARAAVTVERLALEARGARVRLIGPDADAARAIGLNLMDERRVSAALAAGFRQGRKVGR
jgi:NTE family protein